MDGEVEGRGLSRVVKEGAEEMVGTCGEVHVKTSRGIREGGNSVGSRGGEETWGEETHDDD